MNGHHVNREEGEEVPGALPQGPDVSVMCMRLKPKTWIDRIDFSNNEV